MHYFIAITYDKHSKNIVDACSYTGSNAIRHSLFRRETSDTADLCRSRSSIGNADRAITLSSDAMA